MPYTPSNDDRPGGERIDIEGESALRRWARHLGTDPERLRLAVATVGTDVRQLRSFLFGPDPDAPQAGELLPDESPHDANGLAGMPHYDIHKEAS